MPQLDVSTYPSQIFWLIVCFGILCFAVSAFLAPKIGSAIETRESRLREQQKQAEEFNKEAKSIQESNQERLVALRQELAHQHRIFMDRMNQERVDKLREFDQNIALQIKKVQEKLKVDQHIILSNASELIAQIVSEVCPKIFANPIEDHQIRSAIATVIHQRKAS